MNSVSGPPSRGASAVLSATEALDRRLRAADVASCLAALPEQQLYHTVYAPEPRPAGPSGCVAATQQQVQMAQGVVASTCMQQQVQMAQGVAAWEASEASTRESERRRLSMERRRDGYMRRHMHAAEIEDAVAACFASLDALGTTPTGATPSSAR